MSRIIQQIKSIDPEKIDLMWDLPVISVTRYKNLIAYWFETLTIKRIDTNEIIYQDGPFVVDELSGKLAFNEDGTVLYAIADKAVRIYDVSDWNNIALRGIYRPDDAVQTIGLWLIIKKDYFIYSYIKWDMECVKRNKTAGSAILKIDNNGKLLEKLDFFSELSPCDVRLPPIYFTEGCYRTNAFYYLEDGERMEMKSLPIKDKKAFYRPSTIIKEIKPGKFYIVDIHGKNFTHHRMEFLIVDFSENTYESIYTYDYSDEIPDEFRKKSYVLPFCRWSYPDDSVYLLLSMSHRKSNNADCFYKIIQVNYIDKTVKVKFSKRFKTECYESHLDRDYVLFQDCERKEIVAYKLDD